MAKLKNRRVVDTLSFTFHQFVQRGASFMPSYLLSWINSPSKMGLSLKGKDLLLGFFESWPQLGRGAKLKQRRVVFPESLPIYLNINISSPTKKTKREVTKDVLLSKKNWQKNISVMPINFKTCLHAHSFYMTHMCHATCVTV